MNSDFESVAEQFSAINEDGMSRVSKLARLQLTLEERVKALEEDVKETKRSWIRNGCMHQQTSGGKQAPSRNTQT